MEGLEGFLNEWYGDLGWPCWKGYMHHGLGGNDGRATGTESTGGLAETVGDAVSVMIGMGGFVTPIFHFRCVSNTPTFSFHSATSISSQTFKIKASNPLRKSSTWQSIILQYVLRIAIITLICSWSFRCLYTWNWCFFLLNWRRNEFFTNCQTLDVQCIWSKTKNRGEP